MTDNTLVKMEVDYSAEVDKAIPEMQSLAAAGKLTEALDQLYVLEKQTRTAADAVSTGQLYKERLSVRASERGESEVKWSFISAIPDCL